MNERKNYSIYGDAINIALQGEQPWLNSEDLPSYLPFYVDKGNLKKLKNNHNELITGRRGTGKTHLLGAFNELINNESEDQISIMISLNESTETILPNDIESTESTTRRMARAMFYQFLQTFMYKLDYQIEEYLEKKKQLISNKEYKRLKDKVNHLTTSLLKAIELGNSSIIEKNGITTTISGKKSTGKTENKSGIGFSKLTPDLNLKAGYEGENHEEEESKEIIETVRVYNVNLQEVREITEKIIDTCNIKTLYILIDEWMELEKTTSSNIQPYFAQLLKRTFFKTKKISVKIASVWHQTLLYDKKDLRVSKGIQLGHDIRLGPNLDTAFLNSRDEAYNLGKELLFRRLSYECEKLKELKMKDGKIDDIFIVELFDNKKNFNAFLAASHGISRQLMEIFSRCALAIDYSFAHHCIDFNLVQKIASTLYREQKRSNIDPSSSAQKLLNKINKYMESSKMRVFFVENESATESKTLRKLIDEEIIHQIPSARVPRSARNTHKAYHIDYGNYADFLVESKSKYEDVSDLIKESIIAAFPNDLGENINNYTIKVSSIDETFIECKVCSRTFNAKHSVFVKNSICPMCGELT